MDVRPPEAHSDKAVAAEKFRDLPPPARMELPTLPLRQSAHVAARLARPTQLARSPAAPGAQPHLLSFAPRKIRRIRPIPCLRSAAIRFAPPAAADRGQAPGPEQSTALRSPNSTPHPPAGQAARRSIRRAAAPAATLRWLPCRLAAAC